MNQSNQDLILLELYQIPTQTCILPSLSTQGLILPFLMLSLTILGLVIHVGWSLQQAHMLPQGSDHIFNLMPFPGTAFNLIQCLLKDYLNIQKPYLLSFQPCKNKDA